MTEEMIKYIELYNKYEESKGTIEFTEEESKIIEEGNIIAQNNKELNEIMNKSLEERKNKIEEFYQQQEKLNTENEDIKAIKKTYGIDITNVDNKKLDNGVEIFKFYAPKLKRIVVLQNKENMSLSEQLKQKQAFEEKFQTDNDSQNTNNMLEEERNKNDVELKMIYPSEINNYKNTMDEMKPEELEKLKYLIQNAEKLGVKKLNIKNVIYLDQNDDIKEVVYDKEKDVIEAQEPNTLNNNVEQINTSTRIDESLSRDEQISSLSNRYEDEPIELDEYEKLDPDVQAQIKTYKEMPDKLNDLSAEEKRKWEHYIELDKEHVNKQYQKVDMPKQRVLTRRENGAVSVLFLSMISIITLVGMICVVCIFYK